MTASDLTPTGVESTDVLDLAAAESLVEGVLADAPAGRTLTPIEAEKLLAALEGK